MDGQWKVDAKIREIVWEEYGWMEEGRKKDRGRMEVGWMEDG